MEWVAFVGDTKRPAVHTISNVKSEHMVISDWIRFVRQIDRMKNAAPGTSCRLRNEHFSPKFLQSR